MRLNIDKLMISLVMILAVCLYAPTILEDYKATETTNENASEVRAEAPAPVATTETVVLAAISAQENIGAPTVMVQPAAVTGAVENMMTVSKVTPTFQTTMDINYMVNDIQVMETGMLHTIIEYKRDSQFVYPEFTAYVKTLPIEKKPSLMAADEKQKAEIVRDNYEEFQEVVKAYNAQKEQTTSVQYATTYTNITGDGVLTASKGVNYGPSGKETYYNLNMNGVVDIMQSMGYNEEYWVREDGVKMYGDYVMVAADLNTHPRGSLVESSLGTAIVVDTGGFAASDPNQLDIATAW